MKLLLNSFNKLTQEYTEYTYTLPIERGVDEAITEAKRHHPSWTSMVITIVNSEGADKCD